MKHTLTEIVKGTKVKFHSYNTMFEIFTYTVKLLDGTVYGFDLDREDVGTAALLAEDKALYFMRWIKKPAANDMFLKIEEANAEGEFTFSFYRDGIIYYKGIVDGTEIEFPINVTVLTKERTMFNYTENYTTLQQWIQQAQQQSQSEG